MSNLLSLSNYRTNLLLCACDFPARSQILAVAITTHRSRYIDTSLHTYASRVSCAL